MTPEQLQQLQQMQPAAAAGLGVGILIVYLVAWVFMAFCMAKIGEKMGKPFGTGFVMSLIPIANIIYILQLAGKPIWWFILMLIPLVNIVIIVIVFMAICENRGKPGWWGVLMLLPIVNFIILLLLAFGGGKEALKA